LRVWAAASIDGFAQWRSCHLLTPNCFSDVEAKVARNEKYDDNQSIGDFEMKEPRSKRKALA
jgi:hypothetical protein